MRTTFPGRLFLLPDEQRQPVEQLNEMLPSPSAEETLEQEVERKLAAEGLIRLPSGGV